MTAPVTSRATPRKARARSQARIDTILNAARTLLAAQGVASLSIYSVAEHAQIPPSSPSIPSLRLRSTQSRTSRANEPWCKAISPAQSVMARTRSKSVSCSHLAGSSRIGRRTP